MTKLLPVKRLWQKCHKRTNTQALWKKLRKVKKVGLDKGGRLQKEQPVRRPEHLGELVAGDGPCPTKPYLGGFRPSYEHDVLRCKICSGSYFSIGQILVFFVGKNSHALGKIPQASKGRAREIAAKKFIQTMDRFLSSQLLPGSTQLQVGFPHTGIPENGESPGV